MSDHQRKPKVVEDAELFLRNKGRRDLFGTFVFIAALALSLVGDFLALGEGGFSLIPFAVVLASFLGWIIWNNTTKASQVREAKSLIEVYDTKKAAFEIAQDLISPENLDLGIEDERWDGTKSVLDRVRKLAGRDPETLIVIDDIAQFLIDGFQGVQGLRHGLDAERALDQQTPDCMERQARFESKIEDCNARIESMLTALRDVHAELSMREDGDEQALSHRLRDLFHRVSAENEVREQRLPKEEPMTDSCDSRQSQNETS